MYAFMYIDMLCTKLNLLSSPDVTDAWGKVYSLLTKPQTVPSWIVPVISHLLSQMSLNIALLFRRTSQSELMFCGFFFPPHSGSIINIWIGDESNQRPVFTKKVLSREDSSNPSSTLLVCCPLSLLAQQWLCLSHRIMALLELEGTSKGHLCNEQVPGCPQSNSPRCPELTG